MAETATKITGTHTLNVMSTDKWSTDLFSRFILLEELKLHSHCWLCKAASCPGTLKCADYLLNQHKALLTARLSLT